MQKQLTFADLRPDNAARIADIHNHRTPLNLLFDGVTDPKNIAMLLRLADAVRVEAVYFYNCPIPEKKYLKPARAVYPFLKMVELDAAGLQKLHSSHTFVAVEYTSESVEYTKHTFQPHTVLIVGSEVNGISQTLLDMATAAVHLPMLGVNTSINVACAMSVVLYRALGELS
jgi:tRNA G18 (ribose-2'-O)-methylase SpoU